MKKNPFEILKLWLLEASQHPNIQEPTAMVLSTVNLDSSNSHPDSRVVLAKEVSDEGIIFYTNTLSQKGKQLEQSPWCHLLFYLGSFISSGENAWEGFFNFS